jgi:hypothetical protein
MKMGVDMRHTINIFYGKGLITKDDFLGRGVGTLHTKAARRLL